MRISDWSSDVCSSDLPENGALIALTEQVSLLDRQPPVAHVALPVDPAFRRHQPIPDDPPAVPAVQQTAQLAGAQQAQQPHRRPWPAVPATVPVTDGTQADAAIPRRLPFTPPPPERRRTRKE